MTTKVGGKVQSSMGVVSGGWGSGMGMPCSGGRGTVGCICWSKRRMICEFVMVWFQTQSMGMWHW